MNLLKEHIIGLKRNIFGHTLELFSSFLVKIINASVSVNVIAYTLANSSTYFVTYRQLMSLTYSTRVAGFLLEAYAFRVEFYSFFLLLDLVMLRTSRNY